MSKMMVPVSRAKSKVKYILKMRWAKAKNESGNDVK